MKCELRVGMRGRVHGNSLRGDPTHLKVATVDFLPASAPDLVEVRIDGEKQNTTIAKSQFKPFKQKRTRAEIARDLIEEMKKQPGVPIPPLHPKEFRKELDRVELGPAMLPGELRLQLSKGFDWKGLLISLLAFLSVCFVIFVAVATRKPKETPPPPPVETPLVTVDSLPKLSRALMDDCEAGGSKVYENEEFTMNGVTKTARLICIVEEVKK